ncbi:MAG: dTMP kinase [Oligoflexia bacterium]|nr:dTMP kinase [Oligoflexia bacterium]
MIIEPNAARFDAPQGFIVVEGLNGAGKSTLIADFAALIRPKYPGLVLTLEPGGTLLGKKLRQILLEDTALNLKGLTEAFLFAADRSDHALQLIRPALAKFNPVISDRYFYSSIAFQGYGRGLDPEMIEQVNLLAVQQLLPDLVFLIDIDPAQGLARTQHRSTTGTPGADKFEDEKLDFHQRIRDGFLQIAGKRPEQFVILDGSKSAGEVAAAARPALISWLDALEKRPHARH